MNEQESVVCDSSVSVECISSLKLETNTPKKEQPRFQLWIKVPNVILNENEDIPLDSSTPSSSKAPVKRKCPFKVNYVENESSEDDNNADESYSESGTCK